MQRSWEQSVVLVTGTAIVLWVAGIVLFLGSGSREVEHLGLTLVITAAVTTLLGVLRSWQLRMHRSFVHGYHAGFHDAIGQLRSNSVKDCDVLEFSEIKARRLSKLG